MNLLNRGIKFLGVGSYTPPLRVTNEDFTKHIDTSDEWIKSRTGVTERRLSPEKPNYYMAACAAENALKDADFNSRDVDLIIATTCTHEYLYPSLSCLVQNRIKAVNAACYDLNAACTGFIAALEAARAYLTAGVYRHILIVSSEKLSSHVDFSDRSTCVLFGDGAGAALVTASDSVFSSHIAADGDDIDNSPLYYKLKYKNNCPFGDREPDIAEGNFDGVFTMDGKTVYKFAVDAMPRAVRAACEKAGRGTEDIDLLIPHQANIRIIKTAAQSLEIGMDKVYTNIALRGNTSSACIPTCLDELKKGGRLEKGMRLCIVGFGAGLTYGAAYFEYN